MYLRRSHSSLAILFLVTTSLVIAAQSRTATKTTKPDPSQAQPENNQILASWETLKPENEDFSVLMPKDATTDISKFEYHKLELNTRLYMSPNNATPVVAVASISGIKSNPALYTDFERFNSYADAFKTFFPPKVKKDAVAKMILTGSKTFHGYSGRVYKLTVGDLTGTVNAYVTKKRFYAIAILNNKKDEALEDKFLSSFVIPDKPVEQPIAVAEQTPDQNAATRTAANAQQALRNQRKRAEGEPGNTGAAVANVNVQEDNTEYGTGSAQAGTTQNQQQQTPAKRAPIAGGVLNSKAIYLPLPEMPLGEKPGLVMVQVLVDETGGVVEARAISGPPALQALAVNAARLARFMPTVLAGEPVKVTGTLTYNFARPN